VKIEGTHRIAAPLSAVWRKLMDPAVLQRAMPGCEKLEAVGENSFRAVLKAGVGPVKGTFSGEVSLSDVVPERSYTLTSRAKSAAGFVEGTGKIELEAAGKETVIHLSGEVKVGGTLASVGSRLVEAAARKNIRDTFANLAREAQK
jgi:carbon monoxide dehydrogenase subunit G